MQQHLAVTIALALTACAQPRTDSTVAADHTTLPPDHRVPVIETTPIIDEARQTAFVKESAVTLQTRSATTNSPSTLAPLTGDGLALMHSFHFRFLKLPGNWNDDHWLKIFGVQPRYQIFQDKSPDDPYFYKLTWLQVDLPGTVAGATGGRRCEKVACTMPLTPPGPDYAFVLNGFNLGYYDGDHQVDQIGVWYEDGALHVRFNDEKDKWAFRYEVDYVWVPTRYLQAANKQLRGTNTKTIEWTTEPGFKVIQGFDFDFGGERDRNIGDIKLGPVDASGTKVQACFVDKLWDDTFHVALNYAVLRTTP